MAGKKGSKPPEQYYCGRCSESFATREDLVHHEMNHDDVTDQGLKCQTCNWSFGDSLALETHHITTGHGPTRYVCDRCNQSFDTASGLSLHTKPPMGCQAVVSAPSSLSINCDRCSDTFCTQKQFKAHRTFPSKCSDAFTKKSSKRDRKDNAHLHKLPGVDAVDLHCYPAFVGRPVFEDDNSDTPSNLGDGERWCSRCKTKFPSHASYNNHVLRCFTRHSTATSSNAKFETGSLHSDQASEPFTQLSNTQADYHTETIAPSVLQQVFVQSSNGSMLLPIPRPPRPAPPPSLPALRLEPVNEGTPEYICNVQGCGISFRSEAGLSCHKRDAHGMGGQGLDISGRDSWMLSQSQRNALRESGLLRTPPTGSLRGRGRGQDRQGRTAARTPSTPTSRMHQSAFLSGTPRPRLPPPTAFSPAVQPPWQVVQQMPTRLPLTHNMRTEELEQAKDIQGKILRLLLQENVSIHHDGKINACGIDWIRIGVTNQGGVAGMFDNMCHLPRALQSEYLPAPKTFLDEHKVQYPASDFEATPQRNLAKPGLDVITLSCTKILLADGRRDVVKIAAIDVVTGRILMNHLVCADVTARVSDWRSTDTGLTSWEDMEQARGLGYKVFKGWTAARTALSKYVDQGTIIIGYNLRSDLDALRMVHGRAVDIVKVAEKAAKGPLSKAQLSLDSLCRDFPTTHLKSDARFGRDALMNAFAVRELGLWVLKNTEEFDQKMRQMSLDYQRVMP